MTFIDKYDLLLILVFTSFGLIQSKHECLNWEHQKSESTEVCEDINGCKKLKYECPDGAPCSSIYRLFEGKYQPQAATCLHGGVCLETRYRECVMKRLDRKPYPFFSCCCYGPMCNSNIVWNETFIQARITTTTSKPTIPIATVGKKGNTDDNKLLHYVLPSIFGFVALLLLVLYFVKRRKKMRDAESGGEILMSQERSSYTSSLELLEVISYGQFGCVRQGNFNNQMVAVKIITPQGYKLWETESKMHLAYDLKHEHVINFIAAEKKLENRSLQYWIVTEYYPNGSLADYLNVALLDFQHLMKLSLSMVTGLVYLHNEDRNRNPMKPVIAHCDFKSRNVLVKNDLTCCISDLGLAHTFFLNEKCTEPKVQVGTPRYMAPELLQGVMSNQEDGSRLAVDLYALGLVMWEILTRNTVTVAPPDAYQAPYGGLVPMNPTIKDMMECVVENKHRPHLKDEWREHHLLGQYCINIVECWDEENDARLSAECVLERLRDLQQQYEQLKSSSSIIDINSIDTDTIFNTSDSQMLLPPSTEHIETSNNDLSNTQLATDTDVFLDTGSTVVVSDNPASSLLHGSTSMVSDSPTSSLLHGSTSMVSDSPTSSLLHHPIV